MTITILPLGYLQTNCYLLNGPDGAIAIDPGAEPQRVLEALGHRKLAAILLTHGHFDHVGAVGALTAETDCLVYLCQQELSLPQAMTAGPLHYTHTYGEGDELSIAGLTFQVLHTPGHTPGSVCLRFGDNLFSGDTLFAGSCGRTDFPGGDPALMAQSLRRLAQLNGNLRIWPGHGESTTLDEELRYNPYLR